MTFVPNENEAPENTVVMHYDDSVYMRIECSNDIAFGIKDHFTFRIPNAQFHPLVKKRRWDGNIRLFNPYQRKLYSGLWKELSNWAMNRNHKVLIDPRLYKPDKTVTPRALIEYAESLSLTSNGKQIFPRDYQLNAIYDAMKNKRRLIVSPTGSGKSLNIYIMTRMLLNKLPQDKKILILVPTVGLVNQLNADFKDYAANDGSFRPEQACHLIFAGKQKEAPQKIWISTWQSIYKNPKAYFKNVGAIICDEVHLAAADSIKGIMEKLNECDYRIGLTGTLAETKCNTIVLTGLFGIVKQYVKTNELIDQNKLSPLEIHAIKLKHPRPGMKLDYQQEIKYLISHESRNKFIVELALQKPKDNTLVLFNYVEKHGIPLYENLCNEISRRKLQQNAHLVYGDITADEREQIRNLVSNSSGNIIVASYGVFQTGINIPNLHNIVFASPSKSRIRVLQSIGRQLRKHPSKQTAYLYDIGDDLGYSNFTKKHMAHRLKIYDQEKFPYKIINITL